MWFKRISHNNYIIVGIKHSMADLNRENNRNPDKVLSKGKGSG